MLTENYVSGESVLHIISAKWKLVALAITCTIVFIWPSWILASLALVMVIGGYVNARIPFSLAWASFRPAFLMLVFIFFFQVIFQNIQLASFVAVRFILMILAANLLTLTTRSSEIVSALEGLFTRIFPREIAEKISLAISMTLRFIPRVHQIYKDVQDAQRARGQGKSWRALATPLIVRVLKSADEIADAITARSGQK